MLFMKTKIIMQFYGWLQNRVEKKPTMPTLQDVDNPSLM